MTFTSVRDALPIVKITRFVLSTVWIGKSAGNGLKHLRKRPTIESELISTLNKVVVFAQYSMFLVSTTTSSRDRSILTVLLLWLSSLTSTVQILSALMYFATTMITCLMSKWTCVSGNATPISLTVSTILKTGLVPMPSGLTCATSHQTKTLIFSPNSGNTKRQSNTTLVMVQTALIVGSYLEAAQAQPSWQAPVKTPISCNNGKTTLLTTQLNNFWVREIYLEKSQIPTFWWHLKNEPPSSRK